MMFGAVNNGQLSSRDAKHRESPHLRVRNQTLAKMEQIAKNLGLGNLVRLSNYYDEPRLYWYIGRPSDNNELNMGEAVSLDETRAKTRALGEMFERTCMTVPRRTAVETSYSRLKNSANAVNPSQFDDFTEEQKSRPSQANFVFDESSVFRWVEGYELGTGRGIFVPRQLAELALPPRGEAIIRIATSSGNSGWSTKQGAILGGILELVERDAIMTAWLKGKKLRRIKTASLPDSLAALDSILKDSQIELELFDASSDIPIPVVVAVLTDYSPHPTCHISLGSKASRNAEDAALGAIEEGIMIRFSVKQFVLSGEASSGSKEPKDRALDWGLRVTARQDLDSFLEGKDVSLSRMREIHGSTQQEVLEEVLEVIRGRGLTGVYIPLSSPKMTKAGYHVVRVLIPELVPIYFNARHAPLGKKRLSAGCSDTVPFGRGGHSLNHPFA